MATSANVVLFKATIVLVMVCLAECAADEVERVKVNKPVSSCLQYGHSCWGGHGKRNGGDNGGEETNGGIVRMREEAPSRPAVNARWYLSRLIQAPPDLRLWQNERERHQMTTRNAQERRIQNESDVDTDLTKRFEDDSNGDSVSEDADTEEVVILEEPSSSLRQKLRLYKLMKKSAEKLN